MAINLISYWGKTKREYGWEVRADFLDDTGKYIINMTVRNLEKVT